MNRLRQQKEEFTIQQLGHIHGMMAITEEALDQMNMVLKGRREDYSVEESYRIENDINLMRTTLKSDNIKAVNDHQYDYALGILFSDFISECERLGDYIVNVVEARFGK